MNRPILLLLLFVCARFSVFGQEITKNSLVSEGKKHTYYLFIPKNAQQSSPAPLILLLHGSNRNGLSLVEKWKDLATREGIILVGPDSVEPSHWSIPEDGPEFLRELIEAIGANHAIDRRRVYLFGHSGGAVCSLLISLYESEYFAATALHAGALRPEEYSLIEQAKRKIPIFIQVGTMDPLFTLKNVRATRDAFTAQGFAVQLIEIPHHDHWYYDLAPQINAAAWEFLKAHQLPSEPSFFDYHFRGTGTKAKEADDHYNRGVRRQNAGDIVGAIAEYSRAIELDRQFADAYNNRAVAFFNQKEYQAAIADLTKSLEIRPSAFAFNNRGNAYLLLNKTSEGIADLTAALSLSPAAETYYNRGQAYQQDNKLDLKERAKGSRAGSGRLFSSIPVYAPNLNQSFEVSREGLIKIQRRKTKGPRPMS